MSMHSTRTAAPIDWEDMRRRLALATARMAEALEPSADRRREVLEARARDLARRPSKADLDGETIEVLLMGLRGERYAIETRHVRQVIQPGPCTPVPGGHEFLAGVLNLDGEILAVFDLGRALGIGGHEPDNFSRVVVLGDDQDEFGVGVDSTHEVLRIRIEDLFDAVGPGDARYLLKGLTADAVGILDGRELLADGRFQVDWAV
jgi:purine-binding chemotaxis protein CheW